MANSQVRCIKIKAHLFHFCLLVFIHFIFFLSAVAADYTEIKNHFQASRESLPVMFIATPNDKKVSIWTKEGPSVQVCEEEMYVICDMFCVY